MTAWALGDLGLRADDVAAVEFRGPQTLRDRGPLAPTEIITYGIGLTFVVVTTHGGIVRVASISCPTCVMRSLE
jgi:hypothetical protein